MSILKFSKTHEWVKIEKDIAIVGITDYAQKLLGDIVFVELPKIGTIVLKNKQFGTVESTKAASEIFSPISGEIIEVNEDLFKTPQLVNESPFDKGWMVKIKIKDHSELEDLMDEKTYQDFIEKEMH